MTATDGAAEPEAGSAGSSLGPAAEPRWSELAIGPVRLRTLEAGPRQANEAVVFLHGNPGSADDWTELVGLAGETGRAVAMDLPGFGATPAPPGFGHTVPEYAAFLDRALEVLGVERAHLVLHDFGGPIGLAWAVREPNRLAAATLINTGVLPGYRWHRMARVWQTPVLGELAQASTTRFAFRRAIEKAEPKGLPREFVDRMYDQYDRGTRRAVLGLYRSAKQVGGEASDGAIETLSSLDRPALVIWGGADPYIPSRFAAEQKRAFPSAEVHVLPGSGHWPFIDDPETVSALLAEFLGGAG